MMKPAKAVAYAKAGCSYASKDVKATKAGCSYTSKDVKATKAGCSYASKNVKATKGENQWVKNEYGENQWVKNEYGEFECGPEQLQTDSLSGPVLPPTQGTGENVGVVNKNEHKILRGRIEQMELRIKQLELQLTASVAMAPPENCDLNSKDPINSSVAEGLDLEAGRDSMPTNKVIEGHTDECEELNDSLAESDVLNNSENEFKNSASLDPNAVPFDNNATELENFPILKECTVVLENSLMKMDTYEPSNKHPINCDKVVSNLCLHCDNNINKVNAVYYKTLEEKEEEINLLKTRLVQKAEELEERETTNKNLQREISKAVVAYQDLRLKYYSYRSSKSSEEREYEKMKAVHDDHQKEKKALKSAKETAEIKLRNSDIQKYLLQKELDRVQHSANQMEEKCSAMEERIFLLETEFPMVTERFKKDEQKLPDKSGISLGELNRKPTAEKSTQTVEIKCSNLDTGDGEKQNLPEPQPPAFPRHANFRRTTHASSLENLLRFQRRMHRAHPYSH